MIAWMAATTVAMPSVATKELTFSLTTMNPDTVPIPADTAIATRIAGAMPTWCTLCKLTTSTVDTLVTAPADRSYTPAVSGMRRPRASIAATACEDATECNVALVRNRCGFQIPNTMMNIAHR